MYRGKGENEQTQKGMMKRIQASTALALKGRKGDR